MKEEVQYGSVHRPVNFPVDYYPPEDAMDVLYADPAVHRIAEGVFSLSYYVKEDYPAENTIEELRNFMRSKKYVRHELYPEDFAVSTSINNDSKRDYKFNPKETESLRESMRRGTDGSVNKAKWEKSPPEENIKGYVHYYWKEEWITVNDDFVSVTLSYMHPEAQIERHKLFVQMGIYTPSSSKYPSVQKYKKLYPEKFSDKQQGEIIQ